MSAPQRNGARTTLVGVWRYHGNPDLDLCDWVIVFADRTALGQYRDSGEFHAWKNYPVDLDELPSWTRVWP